MVGRHRHLGGADEVHVLALDPVDVVGRLAEEAGAVHRARLDQGRRDHRVKPASRAWSMARLTSASSRSAPDPGEEVEAGCRRPWRRARCRSRRASGRARCGRAARSRTPRGVPTCSSTTKSSSPPAGASSAAGLGMLIRPPATPPRRRPGRPRRPSRRRREVLVRAEQLGLLVPLRPGDQLAELLLLGALGLEVGDRRPAGARPRRAPGRRRRRTGRAWPGRLAHGRGRLAEHSRVDHLGRLSARERSEARRGGHAGKASRRCRHRSFEIRAGSRTAYDGPAYWSRPSHPKGPVCSTVLASRR